MKYQCSNCSNNHDKQESAADCCNEKVYEVSECCCADIVQSKQTEYPLGGKTWGIDYSVDVCEKCGKEVE